MIQYNLSLSKFIKMIQISPNSLNLLLTEEGLKPTAALCDSLRKVYRQMEFAEWNESVTENDPSCHLPGTEASHVRLALNLHARYRKGVEDSYANTGEYQMTEEDIYFELTGGVRPLMFKFLLPDPDVEYQVCTWSNEFILQTVFEVNHMHRMCVDYLLAKSHVYRSEREVIDRALRESWPDAEKAAQAHAICK